MRTGDRDEDDDKDDADSKDGAAEEKEKLESMAVDCEGADVEDKYL